LANAFKTSRISNMASDIAAKVLNHSKNIGFELKALRTLVIQNAESFGNDYERLAGELFDIMANHDAYSSEQLAIVVEGIYRISRVQINKEIQFAGMLLRLLSGIDCED